MKFHEVILWLQTDKRLFTLSVLINQFVPPTFCLCFTFFGIIFRGMLHHVCEVTMTKTCVDQSELVNMEHKLIN